VGLGGVPPRGLTALSLDAEGLVLAARGGRDDVIRYERTGAITVLPDPERVAFQRLHLARERALAGAALGVAVHALARDTEGRAWLATDAGLIVWSEGGGMLAELRTPEPIRGLAWGGEGGGTLYLATAGSLLRLRSVEAR
jgi:ligand-binding sensor domain-containing protein